MSTAERREALFDDVASEWNKVLNREPVIFEVPEWSNKDGPATFILKPGNGYLQSFFNRFSIRQSSIEWASAFLVVSCHDRFGAPFFFDNKDENGNEIPPDKIREQLEDSWHKLMSNSNPASLVDIGIRAMNKMSGSKTINNGETDKDGEPNGEKVTSESVKNDSSPKTPET